MEATIDMNTKEVYSSNTRKTQVQRAKIIRKVSDFFIRLIKRTFYKILLQYSKRVVGMEHEISKIETKLFTIWKRTLNTEGAEIQRDSNRLKVFNGNNYIILDTSKLCFTIKYRSINPIEGLDIKGEIYHDFQIHSPKIIKRMIAIFDSFETKREGEKIINEFKSQTEILDCIIRDTQKENVQDN